MKRICLLAALAGLYGCTHHVDRTPIGLAAPQATTNSVPSPPPPDSNARVTPPLRPPSSGEPPLGGSGDFTDTRIPADSSRPSMTDAVSAVNGQLEDVLFGYDQFELTSQASASLQRDAQLLHEILQEFPQLQVAVEGHCDERGSAEYNLGLGDRRAARIIAALGQLGLPAGNFSPVSYGKEAPQCTERNESCWSRNRRAHFVVRTRSTE
jgi:peptidoglycan-associated lipoprotein